MKTILFCLGLSLLCSQVSGQTGIPVPEMVQSDNLIKDFLNKYDIPGATVAIAKQGRIVYMRAFGSADLNRTIATQPYNLFRIASLSKQITAITIMKLMEEGKLAMSSKVFGPGGILEHSPVAAAAHITDDRIYDITVENLLDHSAGWNRDLDCNPDPTLPYPYFISGCDPISFPLRVTMLTGTSNPVTEEALIQYILEKGLDFAPGTASNYSNIGYLILGKIIEQLSGLPYETYVKDTILAPLGIYDMHIGNNLITEKQEREAEYMGNGFLTLSCYGTGASVPWEYGGFNVHAMSAHGGWIAGSRDMLKLLTAVDGFPSKPDILKPATITVMTTPSLNDPYYAKGWQVNPSKNWWHTGSLDGTASEQVRTSNGYAWVIILNKRDVDSNDFWSDLDALGWNCLASTTTWPSWDLMASPTLNASGISFANATTGSVTLSWTNGNGEKRLVLARQDAAVNGFPLDGTNYTANTAFGSGDPVGQGNYVVYNGTGNSVTVSGLTPGKTYYFRIAEYNKNTVTGNNALYLLGNNPEANLTLPNASQVDLSYFKASRISDTEALLSWETREEVNTGSFEIQRSTDGNSFSPIGSEPARGNSQARTTYSFTDHAPLITTNYYRLKENGLYGDSIYSNTDTVNFSIAGRDFKVIAYPGKNYLTIIKNEATDLNNPFIVVSSLAGQTILKQPLSGGNPETISTPALAAGIYVVTIYNGKETSTQKIIIY